MLYDLSYSKDHNQTPFLKILTFRKPAVSIKIESDLSSQELREYIQILETDSINNWINYDFTLGISKSRKNFKLYLIVGTFVGFLIGAIYVLILSVLSRNKKKLSDLLLNIKEKNKRTLTFKKKKRTKKKSNLAQPVG